MMSLETPLLASNEESAPSLSYQPFGGEESDFSRLLALSHSLNPNHDEPLVLSASPQESPRSNQLPSGPQKAGNTVLAVTCAAIYMCCLWGSYLSPVWSKQNLSATIEWQKTLPIFDDLSTGTIQTSGLTSFLEDLYNKKLYLLLFLTWITGLILPSFFMITYPIMILTDSREGVSFHSRTKQWSGRNCIENSMRFVLLSTFTFAYLNIANSMIKIQWTDTSISLSNQNLGPLAAFMSAVVVAFIGIAVLRLPSKEKLYVDSSTSSYANRRVTEQPWTLIDDEPSMIVLEDSAHGNEEPAPPASETANDTPPFDGLRPLTVRQKVLAYQLGLLSIVLWLPSLYVPFCGVMVEGFAVEFTTNPSLTLYLWDIPTHLWKINQESGTAPWITLFLSLLIVGGVILVPLYLTCLGAFVWLADEQWSAPSMRHLFALHPAACGLVFAIASILVLPNLQHLVTVNDSKLCTVVASLAGENCLKIVGRILPGAYFFLVQSLILESFIFVTLKWLPVN